MQDIDKLIELLNAQAVVSGTALGKVLGISRMGVQKRIQQLVDNGLPIEAVPGKGYSLSSNVSLLSAQVIGGHLSEQLVESVELLQSVGSTNTHLLSQSILPGRARVCVAETQSAGRGRRGNDWQSAPYRNVMLSVSWGFNHWPETITGLGLAVSLVITEVLNEDYGLDVKIKWPNDLMIGTDKLAGILIDVSGESSGVCNVVVGLGLNVHQPDWSKDGDYCWVDLHSQGLVVDRNALIGRVTAGLTEMLSEFSRSGFEPLAPSWNELSSYAGRLVRVGSKNDFVQGYMQGVDGSGALLVSDSTDQMHRFSDSNVSVRLVSD